MARKVFPAKAFNWRIEIQGIDSFECQTCSIPVPETEKVEHGGGGRIVKTPGMVNVGDLVFSKLKPINSVDSEAWDWMERAQSSTTGNGEVPQFIEKDVVIKLLSPDNETTLYTWEIEGVWVMKVEYNELSKTASENVVETVTCSVDGIKLTGTPQQ